MPPGAVVTDFGDLFGRYSRLIGGAVVIPKPPGDRPGQTDDSERHEYHPPTESALERHEQPRGQRAAGPTRRPALPPTTPHPATRQPDLPHAVAAALGIHGPSPDVPRVGTETVRTWWSRWAKT